MLDILQYQFIQNAILTAILVGITTGIISSLVISNRMIFLAGSISHTAYGGIGLAIYSGISVILATSIFTILSSILIALFTFKQKDASDVFIGAFWAFGMSFGIILTDLTPGYNVDLISYLFGSILAVSRDDMMFIFLVNVLIIILISLCYNRIVLLLCDREFAIMKDMNAKLLFVVLLSLCGLGIVASIKAVGLILIIALISIPGYIAKEFSNSLASMMILSVITSIIFMLLGVFLSYMFNISSGASVASVASLILLLLLFYKYMKAKIRI